jgi:hypothetical protein
MSELFVCDPMMPDCHCTKHLGKMEGCLANALGCGDGDLKGSAQTRRQRDRNSRTSLLHITSPYCTGLGTGSRLLGGMIRDDIADSIHISRWQY